MAMKKEWKLALICCLIVLCTCVKAAEELDMAWMKKISLQSATVAAVVGDASGCTFILGDTTEDFGPDYPNLGKRDAYLSKYDSDGELMWTLPLGTEDFDYGFCLTVDAEGNCYVGGQTKGSLAPNQIVDTGDTYYDAFLAKISSEGTCLWIRQFGSTQLDDICQVRLDRSGNFYVAGNTFGCIDGSTENDAGECPFVAKLDSTGHLVWINQVRDANAQTGLAVGVDPNGTIALVSQPGFVTTFDADGIFLETCPLEHQSLRIMDACVDDLGHVYLVGETDWWSRVIQYNFKGRECWSLRSQENGWSNTKSIVLSLDGSHDLITAGCQGGTVRWNGLSDFYPSLLAIRRSGVGFPFCGRLLWRVRRDG